MAGARIDAAIVEASVEGATRRSGGCVRPIRLRGRKELVNTATGELTTLYDSGNELDGHTYRRCGNRRASVCPSCSHEYKGDAWHLLVCGLAGGKGISPSVADRPCTFVTLTALSQRVLGSAIAVDLVNSFTFVTCSCTGSRFQTFSACALICS